MLFRSYICVVPATMAGEEPIPTETGKVFRHENHETPGPGVGDQTLGKEESNLNEMGQRIMGVANSVVQILEKAIIEKRPSKDQMDEATLEGQIIIEESEGVSVQSEHTGLVNGGPHEPSTMDSVLLGAPAKHKSPSLKSDVDSEERATTSARETLRANLGSRSGRKPWTVPTMKPKVGPQDFEDPISDAFWKDIWVASAVHNVSASSWDSILSNSMACCADHPLQTEIYRKVFHAVPDDLITTWKQYKEFVAYHERFNKPVRLSSMCLY